jgi:diguanylate cyclase (GGDEF)-like protein
VTEERASAAKIARLAHYDTLTGLPNRLFVNEALTDALARAEHGRTRCAFMMIDLDRFKAVNDTLGHPVGDRLLGKVSERLALLVTECELVGRLGGDEFAVVVRDASDPQHVEGLARTIIDTLSRPYEVDQHTLYIGASVGVSTTMLVVAEDQPFGRFAHASAPYRRAEALRRNGVTLRIVPEQVLRDELAYYIPVPEAGAPAVD